MIVVEIKGILAPLQDETCSLIKIWIKVIEGRQGIEVLRKEDTLIPDKNVWDQGLPHAISRLGFAYYSDSKYDK